MFENKWDIHYFLFSKLWVLLELEKINESGISSLLNRVAWKYTFPLKSIKNQPESNPRIGVNLVGEKTLYPFVLPSEALLYPWVSLLPKLYPGSPVKAEPRFKVEPKPKDWIPGDPLAISWFEPENRFGVCSPGYSPILGNKLWCSVPPLNPLLIWCPWLKTGVIFPLSTSLPTVLPKSEGLLKLK